MKTRIAQTLLILVCTTLCSMHQVNAQSVKQKLIDEVSKKQPPSDPSTFRYSVDAMHIAIAKFEKYVQTGSNNTKLLNEARNIVESALKAKNGSMFQWHLFIYAYKKYSPLYTNKLRLLTRDTFVQYDGGIEGNTENHHLLYITAFYLAHREWPFQNFQHENYAAGDRYGVKWLREWMENTVVNSYVEADANDYVKFYLICMAELAEFGYNDDAEFDGIKRKARLLMDWLLASGGSTWLKGLQTASASRLSRNGLWYGEDALRLYFGSEVDRSVSSWNIVLAVSNYQLPRIIRQASTDRDQWFETRKTDGRGSRATFYKYAWLTPNYSMAFQKDFEGNNGFDSQAHRWLVRWVTSDDHPAFFIKHQNRDYAFTREKSTGYVFTGVTEYGQAWQHKNSLVAVYNIPNNDAVKYIAGPVSKDVPRLERNGWVVLHPDEVIIAFKTAKPYNWVGLSQVGGQGSDNNFDFFKSNGQKNGIVVETISPRRYSGSNKNQRMEQFLDELLDKAEVDFSRINEGEPKVTYTGLNGKTLHITYRDTEAGYRTLDGEVINFSSWPVVKNPWLTQEAGSKQLTIDYGGRRCVYNFNNWTKNCSNGCGSPQNWTEVRAFKDQPQPFGARMTVRPSGNNMDGLVGLTSVDNPSVFDDLAAIVRFNDDGQVDVRNFDAFTAQNNFAYQAGQAYQVQFTLRPGQQRYDVSIREGNSGNWTTLASNYRFRQGYSGDKNFDRLVKKTQQCGLSVSEVTVNTTANNRSGELATKLGDAAGAASSPMLLVYPNPSGGALRVAGARGMVEVYDAMGRKVAEGVAEEGIGELLLELPTKAGVYLIRNQHHTHKVIRQ